MLKLQEYSYLIIGGTTKAATTSLFYYLADHPQVCASNQKETRFFIDVDYPVTPLSYSIQDGIENYAKYFQQCQQQSCLRLEATPDYLYSLNTPQTIKDNLSNVKIIFILRNPIQRLISGYGYAKQMSGIPLQMTFEEYIQKQFETSYFARAKEQRLKLSQLGDNSIPQEYFFSFLEHGCYYKYLKKYFEILGNDKIHVYFYEDICKNPRLVMQNICCFANLEPEFYKNYQFQVFNSTQNIKNQTLNIFYKNLRVAIRKHTHNKSIHKFVKKIKLLFEPIYLGFNTLPYEKALIKPDIEAKLSEYYRPDMINLEKLLNKSIPWELK